MANPGNGGGIHITGAGEVNIDGSTINNNTATNEGGGIWNSGTGSYTLTNSTISTNSVTAGTGLAAACSTWPPASSTWIA